jgi:hypothetical protein
VFKKIINNFNELIFAIGFFAAGITGLSHAYHEPTDLPNLYGGIISILLGIGVLWIKYKRISKSE